MRATHHRTFRVALMVAVTASAAVMAITRAAAQETTAGTASEAADDILTRYDDATTQQLQAEYDALLRKEEAYLEENPTASFGADEEKANQLADARFRAILDAPVEGSKAEEAEELRSKSESLYALQYWADDAGINIESEIYWGGAEDEAEEHRDEAEELETDALEAEAEEAAREEAAPEGAVEEETDEGAAPPDGGEARPAEEGRPEPEAAPESPADEGTEAGLLAGVNPAPILAFVALVGGALLALSRSTAGGAVARLFRPAMAEARKRPSPRSVPKKEVVPGSPGPEPEETTLERGPERESESDDEPFPDYADPSKFAEYFEEAMREPEPDADAGDELPDDEEPPD